MSDEGVGRYHRAYARLWRHRDFRNLLPDEQRLMLYTLLGPQMNRIGLCVFLVATAADDLQMSPKRLRAALAIIVRRFGWHFDADARVLYIPTWWRWNHPDHSNVLKGCLKDLSEVPPCPLIESFAANDQYLTGNLRESFREALTQRQGKPPTDHPPSPEPSPVPVPSPEPSPAPEPSPKLAPPGTALRAGGTNGSGSRNVSEVVPEPSRNSSPTRQSARRDFEKSFAAFWAQYPNKRNKPKALAAWLKCKPTPALCEQIFAALAWQVTQDEWLKDRGRYIPHPATWLNGERWKDEPNRTPHISDRTLALARATEEFLKS